MRTVGLLAVLLFGCTSSAIPSSAPPAPVIAQLGCPRAASLEPEELGPELECLLQKYVRIDTTNPPGNEVAAAEFLQQVLEREGITAELIESSPGRANLVARVPGKSSASAVGLVHHMDVVPAQAERWSVPPFSGAIKAEELWGRGALDNKGPGILQLLSVIVPHRMGVIFPHDTLLVAVADEEAGGGLGARWLLEHRPELFQGVELVFNEGGAIVEVAPGHFVYGVEIAQKAPLWLRVKASGNAGHGSSPSAQAASHRLVRALARLEAYRFPVRVIPEVQAMFAARAPAMPPEQRALFADLRASMKEPTRRAAFLENPHDAALVQNTLAITMLQASDKENVISGEATAVLDLRLLPGEQVSDVLATLESVMQQPDLELEVLFSWEAVSLPAQAHVVSSIKALAAETHPGAPVVLNVIGGFTDCNAFRAKNIHCYGFLPMPLSPQVFPLFHGDDERIKLPALAAGARNLARLLQMGGIAGATQP